MNEDRGLAEETGGRLCFMTSNFDHRTVSLHSTRVNGLLGTSDRVRYRSLPVGMCLSGR